jgi:hypothetical protein
MSTAIGRGLTFKLARTAVTKAVITTRRQPVTCGTGVGTTAVLGVSSVGTS